MSTHMLTLDSDCVQLIFDRIPTHHLLLHVGRVCHAWQHHQQLNCRARKSLIILQGRQAFYEFTQKRFVKPFNEHNIDHHNSRKNNKFFMNHYNITISPKNNLKFKFLISTFPLLHTLIVSTKHVVSQNVLSLTQLIARYSTKLITLQLYFDGDIKSGSHEKSTNNVVGNLLNQLNLLTSLKHLSFYAQFRVSFMFSINPQIEEPEYLTRIKEFNFYMRNVDEVMLDWVRKYDKAGRLNQMTRMYLSIYPDSISLPSNNRFDDYPLSNLYSIVPYSIRLFDDNEEHLKRIVDRFPSLTTIPYTLEKSITSLTALSTILSPLTKLVHAQLNIEFVLPVEHVNLNSVDQLKSIKALDLQFNTEYSFEFYKILSTFCQTQVPIIVHVFPHLQSIRISNQARYNLLSDPNAPKKLVGQFRVNLRNAYGRESLRTEYINL